ncbi:hypothetical protein [Salisediminibacterium beveridgei]|uniref:Transposase n=1 Tax=Salisediminibacterium beveridgei TaxID=632773 RepID=A0A1D7QZI3_9BACI|nr:hypothetical protein [Salisediminibacterium beveridgei]AOM84408.1 Transposase [Salisediminibacterium beveridgei]
MAKTNTPSFVISLVLDLEKQQKKDFIISTINKESEINRQLYNACLGELLKREKQVKRRRIYKKLVRQNRAISKQISLFEEIMKKDKTNDAYKKSMKHYRNEKKAVMEQIFDLQKECGLSEYSMHEYIKPMRSHFHNKLNSIVAQKTATKAWNTFRKKLIGEAKKVRFIPRGESVSFEGKNNATGWRFSEGKIVYQKLNVPLKVKENDLYMQEALSRIEHEEEFAYTNADGKKLKSNCKVKYVRILKKEIRGKERYFAQLVCQGYPPVKKDGSGKEKYPLGKGRVGGDIGTSTMAFVGDKQLSLFNLGEQIKQIDDVERKIQLLQRSLDRSKRATSPDYFDDKGRIKKGKKTWVYSNRYKRNRQKLHELQRKVAVYRKLSHQYMANRIKLYGNEFYIEKMNIRGLQKRAKETTISEKTGKYQKKKRFGKSIANRAPSSFISILKDKVKNSGGSFEEVNTTTFKASQYNHKTGECTKKPLAQRWHLFDEGDEKVQRDLYSAFLLKNSKANKQTPNKTLCDKTYKSFKELHDEEIKKIESMKNVVLNSGIKSAI